MIDRKYAKIKAWHLIRRIMITTAMLAGIAFLVKVAPNYVKEAVVSKTKFIVNNNNVTSNLKNDIIIKDGIIYLSTDDVKNFFDEYILVDSTRVITTSNIKTVAIPLTGTNILENGSQTTIKDSVLNENGKYYLPMNDMAEIYNFEMKYVESTDSIIIDSLSKKLVQATCNKDLSIKYKADMFSKTVDKVKKGATLTIVQDTKTNTDFEIDGWVRVRTENAIIGYVNRKDLVNEKNTRETIEDNKINGKVSLVWDYYTMNNTAPDRTKAINGVNVVSPSFYDVNSSGTLNVNFGQSGKEYVEWAHKNKYEVWPTVSNSALNNLDKVSEMLSTFENRSKLIDSIINNLITASADGVNIDFENMYKEDKDNYSRFIIELAPRLQDIGMKMCVDVTAPDGSDTWSLCYDRNLIGKITDYLVFIAYDQHGVTSANSIAGADWIELNINKFLGQEGVSADKLIVSMPFYTRLWREENGVLTNTVINMNATTIPKGVNKTWDDNTKQYYIQYNSGNATYKMWIEDVDSITAKLDLINKYNLSGAGFWEKDREVSAVWNVIKEKLNIN